MKSGGGGGVGSNDDDDDVVTGISSHSINRYARFMSLILSVPIRLWPVFVSVPVSVCSNAFGI